MTNTEEGWRQKQCQRSSRLFNCSIPCEASCFASVDLKEKDEFNLLSPSFFYDDESDHVVLQDSSSVLHGACHQIMINTEGKPNCRHCYRGLNMATV